MSTKRKRSVWSIRLQLVKKSKEAALAAVQIFNNPNMSFKSEAYIVLMIIAWTYLMHAYFREKKIEYTYIQKGGNQRHFSLKRCIDNEGSPLDEGTKNNLDFLIGLRNEIEHQMTTRVDDLLSSWFQSCCLNYNKYIKKLFGANQGIDKHLPFSLQFTITSKAQQNILEDYSDLPDNIKSYINTFENNLSDEDKLNPSYIYRVHLVRKLANKKNQADKTLKFVNDDSTFADANCEHVYVKDVEKEKFLPGKIVETIQNEGYPKFKMHHHTILWKKFDAKNKSRGFGVLVANKNWYWYMNWFDKVQKHCENNKEKYK